MNNAKKGKVVRMSKTAFIFPGQGTQNCGMGKDFYDQIPVSKEIYQLAGKVTGLDMEELCFEKDEKLNITEYTQIAILATEVAILIALEQKNIKADVTAGLSLGEYGALVAAEVLTLQDAFSLVRKRGIFMQEAVPTGGTMAAVLGMDGNQVEKICASVEGEVTVANYNCPGQIVITGEEKAVTLAAEKLKEAGAKRCLPLTVSGPFHSPMLKGAGDKLKEALEEVNILDMKIPYIANVTADYVTDKSLVKELLVKQVSSSVKWQQTVERMIDDGVTTFVEIGPGKTLAGFIKKINSEVKVYNVEKVADLDTVAAALNEG